MPQGPGPPQRPHMPGADSAGFPPTAAPTANTLSDLAVFFEAHFGQETDSLEFIDFASFSNFVLQSWQLYS
jgi:hypothetical protein